MPPRCVFGEDVAKGHLPTLGISAAAAAKADEPRGGGRAGQGQTPAQRTAAYTEVAIISAHFQPIIIDGAFVFEVVIDGMIEASATRSLSMP